MLWAGRILQVLSCFEKYYCVEGIISLFQKGIQSFQNTEEKEDLLKLHVRYIKFLISLNKDEKFINKAFKVVFDLVCVDDKFAFEVRPELNSSVFLLYLSWSNEIGIEKAREAIDLYNSYCVYYLVLLPMKC